MFPMPPSEQPTYFRVLNGKVRYPVPLPSSVACGHNGCRGITGHRPWSDSKRRTKLEKHFQDVHGLAFTACYPCLRCGKEFPSAQALNGHLRSSSGCTRGVSAHLENSVSRLDSTRSSAGRPRASIGSSSVNSSMRRSVDPFPRAEIADNNVVALYPGRATRCPWNTLRPSATTHCDRVIQGTGFHILQGLHRHLLQVHKKDMGKLWKCSKCGQHLEDGNQMRRHFDQCSSAGQTSAEVRGASPSTSASPHRPAQPPRSSTPAIEVGYSPTVIHESPSLGNLQGSQRESIRAGAQLMLVETDSQIPAAADQESSADTINESNLSSIVGERTQNGPTTRFADVTALQSTSVDSLRGLSTQSSHAEAPLFFELWANAFLSCRSLGDLNDVLGRCSRDWLVKASRRHPPVEERPPRRDPHGTRKRFQARQLQRIRQRRKKSSEEASWIQRLFMVYPKRAVRHVLGEKSAPYTGDLKSAEAFLRSEYCRSQPSASHCTEARKIFDSCNWSAPLEDQLASLNQPPTREEIEGKLTRAKNTAPGDDGIEYRHLRALDPKGQLMEIIFQMVWKLGIPDSWRTARTVPIYKKGDTSDFSNFRPISLLPTMYKIFSGILSQRLNRVAVDLGWLSPEQKGFLPGVHGIQEHTQLLQTAVEGAQNKRTHLSLVWLDLCNAFGSVPHAVLAEMFSSLPLPDILRRTLLDIYSGNVMNFVVGKDFVTITPSAGVRQGDALSTTVFNLAAEPMIRAVKSSSIPGVMLFGQKVKVTAYADDLAVLCSSPEALQWTLDSLSDVAAVLGLGFNAGKCACLIIEAGKTISSVLSIGSSEIRCLGPEDHEIYLGVPIGTKLTFRAPNDLVAKLDKLADSLLAPWQKLEVYRSHLLPSLSHHLASARVAKEGLADLDVECRKFLGRIVEVPNTAVVDFFYADRKVGGLGTCSLSEDADIWTLARAVQLLSSSDSLVREIFHEQLNDTVMRGFNGTLAPATLPVGPYLSGSVEDGLYRLRLVRGGKNLWTLARAAAKRLRARIDVSGDRAIFVIADDISSVPAKAVRALRTVVRKRHTDKFTDAPHQGKVAKALALDVTTKDIARQASTRTELGFEDWRYLYRARLDLLPLRGYVWSSPPNQPCRRCGDRRDKENAFHLLNHCKMNLALYTKRHNAVLDILANLLIKAGFNPAVNLQSEGSDLRPDIELEISGSRVLMDVRISYDEVSNLEQARNEKVAKYRDLGTTLPLIVGSLGSWPPFNDDIRAFLDISGRRWATFRRKARVAAIKGSMEIIHESLKALGTAVNTNP